MVAIAPPAVPRGEPAGTDYVVFREIPVLDEHVDDEGTQYDRHLLERVAANCNARMQASGDWCPVTIGHTSDDEAVSPPEVVGFAGPFRVKRFGRKFAIYGDFYIFRDRADAWKRNPRRSVEIWPEDRPENRFIDPIALLGAETPRRDLGTYSKRGGRPLTMARYRRRPRFRYSTVAGQYTAGPGRNDKGSTMDQASLQQVIDAIGPIIDQRVEAALSLSNKAGPEGLDDYELVAGDEAGGDEMPPPPELPPELPPDEDAPLFDADEELPPPPAGDLPPGDEPPPPPPEDEEEMQYGRSLGRYMRRYMRDEDDGGFDAEGGQAFFDGLQEPDRNALKRYMCSPDAADDEKKMYAKLSGDEAFQMDGEPQRYQRERNQVLARYRKLRTQYDELKSRYDKQGATLAKVQRYRLLAERTNDAVQLLLDGYQLDPIEEATTSVNDGLTPEQWDRRRATIRKTYRKLPMQLVDFGESDRPKLVEDAAPGRNGKHRSDVSKKTRETCERLRREGVSVSYQKVRASIEKYGEWRPEAANGNGK